MEVWEEVVARWEALQSTVQGLAPIVPGPVWMAPAVALGSLLALAVLAGVTLASFGVLVTSLLAALIILDQVFGMSIDVG
jgi:hypothetical protein